MPKVSYRPVSGSPGYLVGDNGSVWTRWERSYPKGQIGVVYVLGKTWKVMKQSKLKNGYMEVMIKFSGKMRHRLVHRLVMLAFVGPPPEGCETSHEDNDRSNNRLTNLRWATRQENQLHRRRYKTDPNGERQGIASITNSLATKIRERFKKLRNIVATAKEFGLSRYTVGRLVRGQTYKPERF